MDIQSRCRAVNELYRSNDRPGKIIFYPAYGTPKTNKIIRHSIGGDKPFIVFNYSITNTAHGLLERVFTLVDEVTGELGLTPPTTATGIMLLRSFSRNIKSKLPHDIIPYTPAQVLATLSGRKRIINERAFADLEVSQIMSEDFNVKPFVKKEKTKPNGIPRIVSPRGPRANAALSQYIKPIEHHIYDAIDQMFNAQVVAKGMNAREMAAIVEIAWFSHENTVAIGVDAKRFDQHITAELLQFTHNVYTSCNRDPLFIKMLQWRLHNRGVARCADGTIKYHIRGTRTSGDADTSLGNILIMCAICYLFIKQTGVYITYVNNGDDCIFFMPRKHESIMDTAADFFLKFGIRITLDPPKYIFEQVSFCQTQPVLASSGEYIMVRDPRVILTKDSLTTKYLTPAQIGPYKFGIGFGGISVYGDIPILNAFYESIGRGQSYDPRFTLSEEDNRGLYHLSQKFAKRRSKPTDQTRASFMLAFGLTPDHQVALESLFDSFPAMTRSEPVPFDASWVPHQLSNIHLLDC